MHDILPCDSYNWLWLEGALQKWIMSYGYSQIRTPIVEYTELFLHTVGQYSDIVQKEMYSWQDSMNQDNISLRPEGTAPCLRAVLEHSLLYNTYRKLWYMGSMFRHERPQKGRSRQFNQFGVEVLGISSYAVETELILMLNNLWKIFKLDGLKLHINCLGSILDRVKYKEILTKYLEDNINSLQQRKLLSLQEYQNLVKLLSQNPLRILDSKLTVLIETVRNAPVILEHLSKESLYHYQSWKTSLDNLGIQYIETPYLVRGLDYYNLSVFEWISDCLGSQSTVCGGGRYDALFNLMPNKTSINRKYAAGFAIGIERLLLILQESKLLPKQKCIDIYLCSLDNTSIDYCLKILQHLHQYSNNSLEIFYNCEILSIQKHLKKAEEMGARFIFFSGNEELDQQQIAVKNMNNREQSKIPFNNLNRFLECEAFTA